MPLASDRRRDCPYCGQRRGIKAGTDMCLQCDNAYQTFRDNLPNMGRIIKAKFPEFIFMKVKEWEEAIEQAKQIGKIEALQEEQPSDIKEATQGIPEHVEKSAEPETMDDTNPEPEDKIDQELEDMLSSDAPLGDR